MPAELDQCGHLKRTGTESRQERGVPDGGRQVRVPDPRVPDPSYARSKPWSPGSQIQADLLGLCLLYHRKGGKPPLTYSSIAA